jgi:hypothetical protein
MLVSPPSPCNNQRGRDGKVIRNRRIETIEKRSSLLKVKEERKEKNGLTKSNQTRLLKKRKDQLTMVHFDNFNIEALNKYK